MIADILSKDCLPPSPPHTFSKASRSVWPGPFHSESGSQCPIQKDIYRQLATKVETELDDL